MSVTPRGRIFVTRATDRLQVGFVSLTRDGRFEPASFRVENRRMTPVPYPAVDNLRLACRSVMRETTRPDLVGDDAGVRLINGKPHRLLARFPGGLLAVRANVLSWADTNRDAVVAVGDPARAVGRAIPSKRLASWRIERVTEDGENVALRRTRSWRAAAAALFRLAGHQPDRVTLDGLPLPWLVHPDRAAAGPNPEAPFLLRGAIGILRDTDRREIGQIAVDGETVTLSAWLSPRSEFAHAATPPARERVLALDALDPAAAIDWIVTESRVPDPTTDPDVMRLGNRLFRIVYRVSGGGCLAYKIDTPCRSRRLYAIAAGGTKLVGAADPAGESWRIEIPIGAIFRRSRSWRATCEALADATMTDPPSGHDRLARAAQKQAEARAWREDPPVPHGI